MKQDEIFMRQALTEAERAGELGEVPVGAVVVRDGEIIARAHNLRETDHMATAHAELLAIEQACRALGTWRLNDCTLYVTLEPCPMCAGTIVNSRMGRVVYGAKDAKAGAMGSVLNVNSYPFNHKANLESGVLAEECGDVLRVFFAEKRHNGKG
ncbi:MAG: tRNA adenosine(34) deaminase TadA [Clostridia bacterium]|nr:tRNA adenosine(34) deaminase TadA [Clostridia bacterium]